MHFKVAGMKDDLASKLTPVDDFLKEVGLSVERMDKFSIKKSDISETEQKVIVLDIKT
jgi:hypothetical protein